MSIKVNVQPGVLPKFWEHSVIFFANLESLFFGNVAKLNELKSEVSGVNTYGGRLFPILNILFNNDNNVLLLEKEPCKALHNYFFRELDLSLPEIEIFSRGIFYCVDPGTGEYCDEKEFRSFTEKISNYTSEYVDGFVSDRTLMLWAERLKRKSLITSDVCSLCNNKLELYYYLRNMNLPVCDTEIAVSSSDIETCRIELKKKGYLKAVIKSPIGASGIGMMKFPVSGKSPEIPEYFFSEGPCLVQGWQETGIKDIKNITSPSVQVFVGEDAVYLYDITEQILTEDSVHEGNISPPPYLEFYPEIRDELLKQASVAGEWLFDRGYKGTASVDFLVITRNNSVDVYICEINARVTGATYPSVLARYFMPEGAWIMRNLKTEKPTEGDKLIELFTNADALYYPGRNVGFIPINFNLDEEGKVIKGQFLFIGKNLTLCMNTLDTLREALPVEWQYDRD